MDELIKFIAAGGSITTGLLIWYVYKIEPRLRSLEHTQALGQQVDLLKLTKDLAAIPELHDRAQYLLKDIEKKIEETKP